MWCGNKEIPSRNFLVWYHLVKSLRSLSPIIQILRIQRDKSPSYRYILVHLLKLPSTFAHKILFIYSHWAWPPLVFNTMEDGASLSCLVTDMTRRKVVPASVVKQKALFLSSAQRFWENSGQVRNHYLVPDNSTMISNWQCLLHIIFCGSMNHQFRNITQRPHFQTPHWAFPCQNKESVRAQYLIFLSLPTCVYDMCSCKALIKNY